MFAVDAIDYFLALGTVALQVLTFALLVAYFLRKRFPDITDALEPVGAWALWIGFIVTLFSSALTLYYSEILGFAPCGLCWLQRVFLYPQVILFAVALWKRERHVFDYSIALSLLGASVALYQHYLQMGGADVVPCPASGATADCAARTFFEFGYMTFPLMSFTVFALLFVVSLIARRRA